VYNILPHALHGKTVMQFFHWPAQPQNEYFSMNGSALPHSWRFSLADISELIRATLDARRLSREISAFIDTPAEVAILYSQTSTLQLPREMLTWARTPYLAEFEKTYEASRYLDAKVTFITERQINKGWLARYKLLLVPAVRNIPAKVVERIWSYTSAGGRVLITPESFLGDEYNHPRDFLKNLGITIDKVQRPAPGSVGAMVQGYDQSFSQDVSMIHDVSVKVKPVGGGGLESAGDLATQGVRQIIQSAKPAEPMFQYPKGSSALVRIPLGQGVVYYSASSLRERSCGRLLDALFEDASVTRPVRLRNVERDKWKIEARFAQAGRRKLLYVINFHDAPVRLRLEAPSGFFRSLRDLRDRGESSGSEITVDAGQTAIYEML
jgi:beta-galactosidase GanA